jgi:hypothetical protein
MLSYDEVKNFGKKAGKKQSDREKLLKGSEPAKEAMYKKWQETKVAGGTVNPIISTDAKVKENRNLGERKTTTYEETLAKNRRTAGKYNAAVPASAKATKNINELIFGTPKQGGTINPTISAADFSTRFSKMTAREKAVYSHYKQAGKSKEAADYLKSIEMDVNKRAAEQRTADAKKLAEDSTMGGLYARYMGALTSPLATAYSLVQDAKGEAIDPNNPLFLGEQIRQGQTEGFLGESRGAKKWLKEAALGAFDWGSQVATLGALGLGGQALGAGSSAMYGASAFSGNAKDAAERGATTEEAVAYGTIGAAAEVITEKLGFERLFKLGKLAKVAGGKGKLAAEILKSMGSEGLEEGTSEAANQIADALIMGDRSQMAEIYMAAKAAGKTEGEATAAALKGAAGQIGYSAGVGALSGGMIAGGVAGGSRLAGRNVLGEGTTEAEQPLAEEEQTLQTEQNMPSAEQNMPAAEQTMPVTEQTAPVAEEQTTTQPMAEVQKMGQQTAEQSTAERTVFPEAQAAESYTKDLQEYSGKYYGAKGQEVYLRKAAETGNLDHTAAFNTYYRAGIAGITEDEIQPTAYTAAADKLMLNEAYMAGAEDRKTEIANAIRGTNKLTGKRGLIVGEDVKATGGQLAIAKLYADIGGAEIRLVDEISIEQDGKKHTANGYYEDGVITLALKSDSFMGTMNHEMIHYIRKANPAGYDAMRELVFKLANKSGVDMEKRMAEYEEEYGEVYGEDTRMADIMEEMVADGFQKIVENEADLKEFLTELHRKDKTLFDKIKEFLEKMGETIKALFEDNTYKEFAEDLGKDLENIKQLRKKFAEVLADTGRMEEEGTAEQTGKGKYAIKYSEENKPFVAIEKDILDGVPQKEWTKKVKETLKKKYPNGIQIRNEYIHVNGRQTASEMTNSKYARWLKINSPAEYADKLRFANNADEILYAAQNWRGEGLHHPRKDSIVEFARADALIRIGERGYSADVVVGTKGNSEMVLYDILYLKSAFINEKKQEQTAVHSQKEIPTESAAPVSKNSVAQEEGKNNNRNITKRTSADLKGNKKTTPASPLAPADNRNNGMTTLQGGVNTDVINQSVAQKAVENNNRNVTKRTDAELKSFGLQSPSGITEHGSETSIEDLLPKVKGKHNDVKFSIRKKDVEANAAENEHRKTAYEGLLEEFNLTKKYLKDRKAAEKAAKGWLKKVGSTYDKNAFVDRFTGLCQYAANMENDEDYSNILTACTMLAEDALEKTGEMDKTLYNEYASLRKQLWKGTLYINEATRAELEAMGLDYNDLRRENFGRVKLSQKGGERIDIAYMELAEEYPELFHMDQGTSQGELLMDIIAVRESLAPVATNSYGENMEEYAAAEAYELLGMMTDATLGTAEFTGEKREKLQTLREKDKKALRMAREKAKYEKKLLQEKYATNAEARIAAVKEKYEKRIDRNEYWRLRRLAVKDAKALAEWMKSPTDSKHIPKKFKETIGTILGLIETEKPDLRIPLQSFVTMKGALQELYGDQEGLYLYVEQDDQVINILDRFIQKYPEGANLDTMNGADMKYFRNLMASVKKACTDANKLHTSQREKSVIEVSEGFIKKSKKKKDARETGIIRQMHDFLGLEMLDANSFFKRIGGDVYGELWKGLRKGLDKKINHWREAMDFINELVDPKTVRKWTEEAAQEFEIDGTKVQLTVPQRMSFYCLMKRDQGRQHIIGTQIPTENGILDIRGGGFKAEPISHTQKGKKAKIEKAKVVEPTAADIQAILDTLTEEQKKAAEAIQKYLSEDVAAWGNETTMLLFGYEKFTTKNYFPIVSDKNFVNQLVTKTDDIAPSLKSLGMTKNINRFANNPVMIQDIFKVFANHVDQMSNYNAFAASESDFNKFMNYKKKQEKGKEKGKVDTVRNEMDRTMGKGGAKYIKTLMNRLVTASGLSDDSDFAKMLVRNMKVASVGANLRVIVQQPTAYLRAGNSLSMKYLLNPAVFKKTDKETIYKYAPIALWKSWGNYEMDTGKTMYEQMIAPTKAARTKELLMAGAGWADEVTWSRLWNACVLEAKDKHKGATQEEIYTIAGERFGEIVDESQVVDSVLHRSQIMRKKGLYTQMTTSFMSEPTKTFNMASNALVELVRNNTPENRRKFVRCYMTIIASSVATACAAGLVDAMRDDDDDDTFLEKWKRAVAGDYSEAETPKDYIMAVLSNNIADNLNPMGMIPYLRDGWSLLQGYDINRTDFDWLNDIMKNIKRWEQFAAGESEYTLASLLLNTTGAISKMTGVPIGSAERDLKALTNWVVLHIIGDDEMKFNYKKLSKDVGSEKNASYYAERMLKAKFSGNDDLATRIYNEMIAAGVSNEKIDNKLESKEKKLLKEEPETTAGAEAYAAGDYSGYMNAIDSLTAKGYGKGYAVKVIESVYKKMKGGDDEGETFEPITNDYWDNEPDKDPAGYEMMFNAYMSGNINDYSRMWDRMEANGKEEGNIKSSMKSRLKKAYQAAKAEGDYQKAQRAKTEFLRLGGKPETLEG